ncbi:MAG: SURF1 family protein [Marinospirillum sp.]|uniref:SURF1 family protein n=1 Tax=Marinospirillum sp. TaxID=2183934 RepID=UPI0019FF891B|nr:SURF1 family protein [Marinospirillum sp.]MBE0507841.1 SURF1 family protein [Marinospirillum sp.]
MTGSSRDTATGMPVSSGQSGVPVKHKTSLLLWWSFWLGLVVLGLLLANWQLQRGMEKQRIDAAMQEAPLRIYPAESEVDVLPPAPLTRLQLRGEFMPERTLWLDNRILNGKVGVAALTPLQTRDGRWWLIQRGFVATSVDRSQLPQISTPTGEVTLTGRWQPLQKSQALVFGDNREGDRLQSISLQPWQDLGELVFAGVVHQESGAGGLDRWWSPSQMTAERHWGYAVQWLLLAGLALLMAFIGRRKNA